MNIDIAAANVAYQVTDAVIRIAGYLKAPPAEWRQEKNALIACFIPWRQTEFKYLLSFIVMLDEDEFKIKMKDHVHSKLPKRERVKFKKIGKTFFDESAVRKFQMEGGE